MYLKQTMLVLAKDKGEGIKHFMRTQPDIPGFPRFYAGLEDRSVGLAHNAIETICCDQQVILG